MKKLLLFLLLTTAAWASPPPTTFPVQIRMGATDPATCSPSNNPGERNLFWNTTTGDLKECRTANTWSYFLSGSSAFNYVATALAINDMLKYDGTNWVNFVSGLPIQRTVSGTSATLDCSNATGDRNKVVVLSNAGAIALTGFTPGVNCPDGSTIFVHVTSATATVTLTPAAGTCNGDSTCLFGQGFWRVRSNGSNTFVPGNEHAIDLDITGTGVLNVSVPTSFACTVYEVAATGSQLASYPTAGTIVLDLCKKAGALPTACTTTDKISGTNWTPLSTATYAIDSTLTGWTKTVAVNDVFDGNVGTFTTFNHVHLQLRCH